VGKNLEAALDTDGDGIIDALDVTDDVVVKNAEDAKDESIAGSDTNSSSDSNTNTEDKTIDKQAQVIEDETNVDKSVTLELTGTDEEGTIQSAILYFPFLSADPMIKGNADRYLDKVANWMKQNPEKKLNLIGHTDNVGSKQSNLALGIKRVMVIRELLINKGSPMRQIEIMSKGESQPIKSNKTEAGRFKNRRVEIAPIK